jgi:hypothetical protein
MPDVYLLPPCRFTTSGGETTRETPAQEGAVARHLLMAEEVRALDVVRHDGASGRAAEAALLGVHEHGGNFENCRDEEHRLAAEHRQSRAGCAGSVAAL